MQEKKLSIILPVYNVEDYSDKCLDSMLTQTYENYELIIVKDGRTDSSESIIAKYVRKYPDKIVYIKINNRGLSGARNEGLKHASGDYIAFFDSDDYIKEDMYFKMMELVNDFPYDMVVCDLFMSYPKKDVLIKNGVGESIQYMETEYKKILYKTMYIAVHNKIIRKDLLSKKPFVKDMCYEDILFTYKLLPSIKSIGVVNEPLYYYIQRPTSISNTIDRKLYDILDSMYMMTEWYILNGLYDEYKDILDYTIARYSYGTFMSRLARSRNKEKYDAGFTDVKNVVETIAPDYSKSKFFKIKWKFKDLIIKYYNKFWANIVYYIVGIKR